MWLHRAASWKTVWLATSISVSSAIGLPVLWLGKMEFSAPLVTSTRMRCPARKVLATQLMGIS